MNCIILPSAVNCPSLMLASDQKASADGVHGVVPHWPAVSTLPYVLHLSAAKS